MNPVHLGGLELGLRIGHQTLLDEQHQLLLAWVAEGEGSPKTLELTQSVAKQRETVWGFCQAIHVYGRCIPLFLCFEQVSFPSHPRRSASITRALQVMEAAREGTTSLTRVFQEMDSTADIMPDFENVMEKVYR